MLYHILPAEDWQQAREQGVYRPVSLETEGFIHCSDKEQVVNSANLHFKGIKKLLLLCIDEKKVQAEIQYEDLYNTSSLFPHIYGELNLDTVLKVLNFPSAEDGTFSLPDDI